MSHLVSCVSTNGRTPAGCRYLKEIARRRIVPANGLAIALILAGVMEPLTLYAAGEDAYLSSSVHVRVDTLSDPLLEESSGSTGTTEASAALWQESEPTNPIGVARALGSAQAKSSDLWTYHAVAGAYAQVERAPANVFGSNFALAICSAGTTVLVPRLSLSSDFDLGDGLIRTTYFISLHGEVSAESSGPARGTYGSAAAHFRVEKIGVNSSGILADESASVNDAGVYGSTFPEIVFVEIEERANQNFGLKLSLSASVIAKTNLVTVPVTSHLLADYGKTVHWRGLVDAIVSSTGQHIPPESLHLIDDYGNDWAHPTVSPEPAAISLLMPVAFLHRRRNRG